MNNTLLKIGAVISITALIAGCNINTSSEHDNTFESTVLWTQQELEDYWGSEFTQRGRDYRPEPKFYSYEEEGDISCVDQVIPDDNAVYCGPSNYVAYDNSWAREAYDAYGPTSMYFLIAHEYAHSVQYKIGEDQKYTVEYELQADCMAGAFIGDKLEAGEIDLNTANSANLLRFIYSLGDPDGVNPTEEDAHGTGEQRYNAFMVGYRGGIGECGLELDPYQEVFLNAL